MRIVCNDFFFFYWHFHELPHIILDIFYVQCIPMNLLRRLKCFILSLIFFHVSPWKRFGYGDICKHSCYRHTSEIRCWFWMSIENIASMVQTNWWGNAKVGLLCCTRFQFAKYNMLHKGFDPFSWILSREHVFLLWWVHICCITTLLVALLFSKFHDLFARFWHLTKKMMSYCFNSTKLALHMWVVCYDEQMVQNVYTVFTPTSGYLGTESSNYLVTITIRIASFSLNKLVIDGFQAIWNNRGDDDTFYVHHSGKCFRFPPPALGALLHIYI
jgi:hypothetical protein